MFRPQPEPDPGLQAVEVERAGQRRAAYLQPPRVHRPVLAQQDVPDRLGAQLTLGGGAQVKRLAGHRGLDQAALEVGERRHGAEG